jgi:hypothetical protein
MDVPHGTRLVKARVMTDPSRRKVFAYITRLTTSLTTNRNRLLVFSHPLGPEAGTGPCPWTTACRSEMP